MKVDSPNSLDVCHVIGDGIFAPVLDSQLVVPLQLLGQCAPEIGRHVIFLSSMRHGRTQEVEDRIAHFQKVLPGVSLQFRRRPPGGVPFQRSIWARLMADSLDRIGLLRAKSIVLHCRGESVAAAAALVRRCHSHMKILLDVRGASSDEARSGILGRYLARRKRNDEWCAFREADGFNTVSERMGQYYYDMGMLDLAKPRTVVGCCVDLQRFHFDDATRETMRSTLGVNGRLVIVYCGGASKWQNTEAMAKVFQVAKSAIPAAFMLIVSHEYQMLCNQLCAAGVSVEDMSGVAAAHEDVARYLMAGDVGLLLRDDTVTNHVASPVKFAEYLRCGLPVILTPYVGDYGAVAESAGIGKAIELPVRSDEVAAAVSGLRDRLSHEGNAFRKKCSDYAEKHLSWNGQIEKVVQLYRSLQSKQVASK